MRRFLLLSAALLAVSGPAFAQALTADQIVNGLLPAGMGGPGRGIRLAAPEAAPAAMAAAPKPAATTQMAAPSVNLQVNFLSGSSELTPAATRVLDTLAGALKDTRLAGAKFRIEGHTDTAGTADTNRALSEKRAAVVTEYLVAKHGVERGRLTPVGMGQDSLLVLTPVNTNEARNRRVTVVNLGG